MAANGQESVRKLERKSRALCRALFRHGWTRLSIAEELECSKSTVSRVIVNEYQDCLSEDGIHISAELSLKYGLVNSGSEVQGAASASTHPDHPIRCTPMPQPRPASFGPGRAKGMSPQQRALVRVLFSKNQSTATLAIHFRVSPSMIKYAIDNNYSPPDDIEKDPILAPASEVDRHLSLIKTSSTPRQIDPAQLPATPSSPIIRIRPRSRADLERQRKIESGLPTAAPVDSPTQPQRRQSRGYIHSSVSTTTINRNGLGPIRRAVTDENLSAALERQSLQHLAEGLAKLGITDVKTLKQANQLDAPGDLITHDFWRPLIDTGVMTTLEFFLLRQIALSH